MFWVQRVRLCAHPCFAHLACSFNPPATKHLFPDFPLRAHPARSLGLELTESASSSPDCFTEKAWCPASLPSNPGNSSSGGSHSRLLNSWASASIRLDGWRLEKETQPHACLNELPLEFLVLFWCLSSSQEGGHVLTPCDWLETASLGVSPRPVPEASFTSSAPLCRALLATEAPNTLWQWPRQQRFAWPWPEWVNRKPESVHVPWHISQMCLIAQKHRTYGTRGKKYWHRMAFASQRNQPDLHPQQPWPSGTSQHSALERDQTRSYGHAGRDVCSMGEQHQSLACQSCINFVLSP